MEGNPSAVRTWTVPECPFTVEYSTRVLDDIRLSVMDAFFSLPRGGAEIGGILLGEFAGGRISIQDYQALDCEHAMGPSFTLSPRDREELAKMVAKANGEDGGPRVVGWYHSHTRSGIFLSEADQEIHQRFFPEPWQVALVIKPHTFEPARGGFFFREADGSIRGAASYQEFSLEPLPVRPVPRGDLPAASPPPRPLHPPSEPHGPVITVAAESQSEPDPAGSAPAPREFEVPATPEQTPPVAPADAESLPPMDLPAPQFLQVKRERSWTRFNAALAVAAGLAIIAVGYLTRELWFPSVAAKAVPLVARIRPSLPQEPERHLSLLAVDNNGQLQIHWDARAPVVTKANGGRLLIVDGAAIAREIELDPAHLHSGAFTYERASERVDVTLMVDPGDGDPVKEVTSFLGKLPDHKASPDDAAQCKECDDLRQEAAKLKQDLNSQAARTRRLEKDLNDVREQLRKEERRRLGNQAADPGK